MRVVGSEARQVLIRPGVFSQKDIGVLEAFEKDLEAARLGWEGLLFPIKAPAIPEWIVERLGREPHDVRVWDEVGPKLAVKDVGSCFADVGQVRDETKKPGSAKRAKQIEGAAQTDQARPKQQGNRFL